MKQLSLLVLLVTSNYLFTAAGASKLGNCIKNLTSNANTNQNKCISLNHPFCNDVTLPYKSTILPEYVPNLEYTTTNFTSIGEVKEYLIRWQEVERIPKCWLHLQRALYSILMPECIEESTTGKVLTVSRPNFDICNNVLKNCKFINRHYGGWPAIFNCSDTNLYATNCSNKLDDIETRSVSTGRYPECKYPLVSTVDNSTWFKDIEGCSLNCKHPVNLEYLPNINLLIHTLSSAGLLITLMALYLFTTGEKFSKNKSSHMAKVIQRCVTCQFFFYLGWSLQMFSNVACAANGSPIYGLTLERNMCVLSFFLTYLPSLSSLLWCAFLGKLCHEKLTSAKTDTSKRPESSHISPAKNKTDHILKLVSYFVPPILFIIIASSSQIDGHGLHGICSVGQRSIFSKATFVFLPKAIATIYGNYYFMLTIVKLGRFKHKTPSLKRNLIRIVALVAATSIDLVSSIWTYVQQYLNRQKHINLVDDYIACSLNLKSFYDPDSVAQSCSMSLLDRPSIEMYYIEIASSLSIGIIIASWAYCESNLKALRKNIAYNLDDEYKEFKRRAQMNPQQNDRQNSHDLIDVTTFNRTNNQQQQLESIVTRQEQEQELDVSQMDEISITNPSLASTSIASFAGSTASIFAKMTKRFRHSMNENYTRASDITRNQRLINDILRQSENNPQLAHLNNVGPIQAPLPPFPVPTMPPIMPAPDLIQIHEMMANLMRSQVCCNQPEDAENLPFTFGMAEKSSDPLGNV